MDNLFEPVQIKNMILQNRFVRSATVDNGAESGYVSEKQVRSFTELSDGGIGLIVTGMTAVHSSDYIKPSQNQLSGDDRIPAYKRLTSAVHKGGAKIAIQLAHMGRERGKFLNDATEQAVAPSFIENDPYCEAKKYRAMTTDEIREIIEAFGNAAKRAREAGFDAVQIHGAHAFLFAQFLSPYTNRRDDEWGGSLENRLRFHTEIYSAIRRNVGEDYPVLIKLGVEDGFSGGLDFSDGKRAAQILSEVGFDALEISQGLRGEMFEGTEEAYFRAWGKEVKQNVNVPVMMVGGFRTPALMMEIIEKGEADFIALCRPFIREPGVVSVWQKGDLRRSRCISCNKCIEALKNGEFLHCPQNKNTKSWETNDIDGAHNEPL
jgi:2,4-dienoyl-CoA reductase-like NADH-dependent reductase (Old Yellow Enzyme family)